MYDYSICTYVLVFLYLFERDKLSKDINDLAVGLTQGTVQAAKLGVRRQFQGTHGRIDREAECFL